MSREWIIDDDFLDEETKSSADGQGYLTELVRCKDCKYQEKFFHEDKRRKEGGYYIVGCELVDGYSHVCFDDDFCSRAERKDIAQEKQER